ncbi:MAG: hypothetical protein Q8N18_20805 [Opitutaceae bacterium]|nr:hypothetical protein [Opitutaceae bacterium]
MRLCDPREMTDADWPAGSARLRAYVEAFAREGAERFIANLHTTVRVLRGDDWVLPVTINDADYDNTYFCSPYTAYCPYAKEELRLIDSAAARAALGFVADAAGAMLKAVHINRIVHVNNWMLSTNLYPAKADLPVAGIADYLAAHFPDHFICFRSLNTWSNAALLRQFAAARYWLVASRQVYCYERLAETWARTLNAREDGRLRALSQYRVVDGAGLGESDYVRMAELYRLLYIEKYSQHNPVFTPHYLQLCHQSGVMVFFGLRGDDGVLDGVLGLFTIDGVVTAPIVGYDTVRDRRLGLYRLLMALTYEFAQRHGHRLNLSSGAAEFKRLRGGRPFIEYSAIFDRHLSAGRRAAVSALRTVVNGLGVPLMRKLRL